MNKDEERIATVAYMQGLLDIWKMISKMDREHPEYKVPFELFQRFSEMRERFEERLKELK